MRCGSAMCTLVAAYAGNFVASSYFNLLGFCYVCTVLTGTVPASKCHTTTTAAEADDGNSKTGGGQT
jgi:hypothetical protein